MNNFLDQTRPIDRRMWALVAIVAATVTLAWIERRALASSRDTHAVAQAQLDDMRTNAAAVRRLRKVPETIAGRTRPNAELLLQVEKALVAAGIERSHWHDSVPQTPQRLPQSDFRRHTTQLYLEDVTPRQIVSFEGHLRAGDSTLDISRLHWINRKLESASFDVELGVSYLVYAPERKDNMATVWPSGP